MKPDCLGEASVAVSGSDCSDAPEPSSRWQGGEQSVVWRERSATMLFARQMTYFLCSSMMGRIGFPNDPVSPAQR